MSNPKEPKEEKKPYCQFKLCKKQCLACKECGYFWGPAHKLEGQRVEPRSFTPRVIVKCPVCLYYVALNAEGQIEDHLPHLLFTIIEDLEKRRKACQENEIEANNCNGSGITL